jgi:hypothetical protein
VLELSVQVMPVEAPQAARDAAGRAQQAEEINFAAHLEPWMPETFFLGAKLKYGFVGIGSVRRCAMAWHRGLKMGKGYLRELGKDEARLLVSALSPEDLAEAARQQGMLTWRIGSLHRGSNETLMHARLLARALTLEQYEAMPEQDRRQLCDQLWARAVADSNLRRAGGEAAVRLWQLKELRALPSPSAAELATRTTLEAGEAADEEAVAEKAQIKRTAMGDLTAEEAIAIAADERLTLVTAKTETGYKGVSRKDGRYELRITENGKQTHIGSFGTAEHAALQYARLLGPEGSAAAPARAVTKGVDLTAEEAIAQAVAEKLTLVTASIETGYKGVWRKDGGYRAVIYENGKQTHIGNFGTAERAALQYARLLGPERSAAAAAAAAAAVAAAAASGHSRKRRADGAPAATTSGRIRRAPSCRE